MSKTLTKKLSPDEQSALAECETVIERGKQVFIEVGEALQRIRDDRLYRETHGTFESYCQEKWGLGKVRAFQIREASKAVGNLKKLKIFNLPQNEAQAAPLAKLPKSKQSKAWKAAVKQAKAEDRPVRAKDVEQAVQTVQRGGLAAQAMAYRATTPARQTAPIIDVEAEPSPVDGDTAPGLAEAVRRVKALYERNKPQWNAIPPPTPRQIVDAVLKELEG